MAHVGLTREFWQGRRVLITGHTGFKGGWLSLWLQSLGADVHGFALPASTSPCFYEAARVADGIDSILGDLRDAARVLDVVESIKPEVVFHLAAQAIVKEGYRDPVGTMATNVMGTVNLLEAVRSAGSIKSLLVVTSDKCYQNQEWLWPYRENEPMGGRDPYSVSKACAELVTAAWRDSYLQDTTATATARAGNIIGGGDWALNRLIPDALKAWQEGAPLTIRFPRAVRPWQYVLDGLAGYIMLAAELAQGRHVGACNFGPIDADMLSVESLLQRLADAWGPPAQWVADPSPQPHEALLLRLDSSKARAELGWKTHFSIDQSIEAIIAWQRAWLHGEDMRQFSLKQIDQYVGQTQ